MRSRIVVAIVAILVCAGQAAADEQLITQLKALGKAVDDMSANISKAATDADAQTIANAVREALDKGLKADRPTIVVKASAGRCSVTIETPGWKLWSDAQAGRITGHGATVR